MRKRSRYIKIEKSKAQRLFQILKKDSLSQFKLDRNKKVLYEGNYVLFPYSHNLIKVKHVKQILNNQFEYQIILRKSIYHENPKARSLKKVMSKELPKKLVKLVPHSYDIIGNIAILEFDNINTLPKEKYNKLKQDIAEKLLTLNKSILSIYEKASEIKGEYRLRDLSIICGEDKSETIHKENNCQFKLDVKKTYFSPRLVFERKRVASLNYSEGERIIDLFAGVGPFSIQIAKNNNVIINAFDVNPNAYFYLKENLRLNKIKGKIIAHQLDVFELIDPKNIIGKSLANQSNRIIMNLPEKALEYLKIACYLLNKTGGIIHIYQFCEKPMTIKKSIEKTNLELKKIGWHIEEIMNAKVVKPFSPKADLIVLDLKVKKN